MSNVIDINEYRLRALETTIVEWQCLLIAERSAGAASAPRGFDESAGPRVARAIDHVHRRLSFAAEAATGEGDALTRYQRVTWRLERLLRDCEQRARPAVIGSRDVAAEALTYRRCVRELRRRLR